MRFGLCLVDDLWTKRSGLIHPAWTLEAYDAILAACGGMNAAGLPRSWTTFGCEGH